MRNTRTDSAINSRMHGYSSAAMTLPRSSLSRAWKSAIWLSTKSRNPPVSPASTMATYTRGKTSGDFAIASASDMPSTTRSWTSFHFSWATGVDASL